MYHLFKKKPLEGASPLEEMPTAATAQEPTADIPPADETADVTAVDTATSGEETPVESPPAEDAYQRLLAENEDLKRRLSLQEVAGARMQRETEEFFDLFPEVSLMEVPETVWDSVRQGIPLSAAYARHERKLARAAQSNRDTAERSSGSVQGGDVCYFSPDEVRAMSAQTVRDNMSHILTSMKHWN